ncbi:unnamed protein product, partial [Pylaiella littoralis]
GKQVKAIEGDVKKMQTSMKDLKAGVTTAAGKAKTSQKGMSETKMLEIVKASDSKRAADLKILIESEVRAIKADLLAAYEENVARLEAAMKAESAQVLANMANGLHYVVREVVSQVER